MPLTGTWVPFRRQPGTHIAFRKQARRTGMAGPLGEMFDHGCDAMNTTVRHTAV